LGHPFATIKDIPVIKVARHCIDVATGKIIDFSKSLLANINNISETELDEWLQMNFE
jgi:hypothetical protein